MSKIEFHCYSSCSCYIMQLRNKHNNKGILLFSSSYMLVYGLPDYCNTMHISIGFPDYCNTISICFSDYCNTISIGFPDYCNTISIGFRLLQHFGFPDYCNTISIGFPDYCNTLVSQITATPYLLVSQITATPYLSVGEKLIIVNCMACIFYVLKWLLCPYELKERVIGKKHTLNHWLWQREVHNSTRRGGAV